MAGVGSQKGGPLAEAETSKRIWVPPHREKWGGEVGSEDPTDGALASLVVPPECLGEGPRDKGCCEVNR